MTCAILAAGAWPAAAQGQEHGSGHGGHGQPPEATGSHLIAIANRAYSPVRLTALAGDSVTWRNDDFITHDATGSGGLPASGPLTLGQRFTQTFADVGSHPFICTFHPFMQGRIDVHAALLTAASSSVLPGEEMALHGRAAATGGPVVLEAQPAGAAGFAPVTTVAPGADGAFHAALRPSSTTTYRAVTTAGASPPVTVTVTSKLRVRLSARRTSHSRACASRRPEPVPRPPPSSSTRASASAGSTAGTAAWMRRAERRSACGRGCATTPARSSPAPTAERSSASAPG